MDWPNEEYVRVYTRETADDLDLSWEALALWRALLLKFDRSGLIAARNGWLSVARMTRIPVEVVDRVGPELIKDGRIKATSGGFLAPNFVTAQTASKSDKLRQRESRDRRREHAASQVIESTDAGHNVSQTVTQGHAPSQNVTLCSALLCDPSALRGSALLPGDGSVEPSKPRVTRERTAKVPLPDDWQPARSATNLEAESLAVARGVDIAEQLKSLRDWAKSNNAKKADWDSTWRNWTRNAKPSGPQRQAKTPLELQLERVLMLEEQERNGGDT